MHFASPGFLYLILVAPVYAGWIYYSRKNHRGIRVSVFDDLKRAGGKTRARLWLYARHTLVIAMIVLFGLVLARPQGAHEKQEVGKKGIDIIIAIDVSESMQAEDLKPNRIEAAKSALNNFIDGLQDDRLGLVVFAGQAFTQSPLTFDYNILREYIKNISTDSINSNVRGLSGTAVGDAILSAVNRFKDSGDRTKVLVVITDGDANTGADPEIAAQKAGQEGIKIYTVGVGAEGGAPIPATDMAGQKTYLRNNDGSLYMATFNEAGLRKIAAIGQGTYFRAGDNQSFKKVMAEINSLEKRDINISVTTEYTENFMPYLTALAALFVIYLLILSLKTEIK